MSKNHLTHYVIVYDIADDKRRNKIFNIMKDYAHRVQYSVFEAELRPESMIKMRRQISKVLHAKEDSVIYYTRCGSCKQQVIRDGKSYSPLTDEDWYYV